MDAEPGPHAEATSRSAMAARMSGDLEHVIMHLCRTVDHATGGGGSQQPGASQRQSIEHEFAEGFDRFNGSCDALAARLAEDA